MPQYAEQLLQGCWVALNFRIQRNQSQWHKWLCKIGSGAAIHKIKPLSTKKYFRLCEEKNNNGTWIKANGCTQAEASIGEEQLNKGKALLLWLSRWQAETFKGLITIHTGVNYHGHKNRSGGENDNTFLFWNCEALSKTNTSYEPHREPCFKVEDIHEIFQWWRKVIG